MRRLAYRLAGRLPVSAKLFLNRRLNPSFLVGLLAVVRNEHGHVLVVRHTYRPFMPHGIPSGWLERGESVSEAMRREVAEETGFDVAFRRVLQIDTGERPTRLDVWLEYELAGGSFRPSAEVSEAAFYPLERLPPLLPAQREFLTSLASSEDR